MTLIHPDFSLTFSGLPFGPRPLPGPAPLPTATPTPPPTIPLPLLAVLPPLDHCSAAPAHRLPHPLVTLSHPFAAPAVPCAPPAPPARYFRRTRSPVNRGQVTLNRDQGTVDPANTVQGARIGKVEIK
ncbi:hypothetical protein B0H14DRAFT_3469470 [Mycena olivaceomarginata]|nr:hypothetical protein B0H14DRAFT_3469470 [Mycena olivaceomarginata]